MNERYCDFLQCAQYKIIAGMPYHFKQDVFLISFPLQRPPPRRRHLAGGPGPGGRGGLLLHDTLQPLRTWGAGIVPGSLANTLGSLAAPAIYVAAGLAKTTGSSFCTSSSIWRSVNISNVYQKRRNNRSSYKIPKKIFFKGHHQFFCQHLSWVVKKKRLVFVFGPSSST